MGYTKSGIWVVNDNTGEVMTSVKFASIKALEIIGGKAETYAKYLCPVGTVESTGKKGYRGGTLRNSIAHKVDKDKLTVTIGSNVEYAPYVELGTGPYFDPPPDWEQFGTKKGAGIGNHGYVKPRKYLQPAIVDHLSEYKDILEDELQHA